MSSKNIVRKRTESIFGYWLLNQLLVLVVQLVSFLDGIEDLFGHASQVEGSVRSISASGSSPSPSITTTVSGVLAQEWVADSSQSQEDDDGSEGKEESGAKVERESSVGVTVRVVGGVGVVVVLLRVPSSGGFVANSGRLGLFSPNSGKEKEGEGKGENDLSHHLCE